MRRSLALAASAVILLLAAACGDVPRVRHADAICAAETSADATRVAQRPSSGITYAQRSAPSDDIVCEMRRVLLAPADISASWSLGRHYSSPHVSLGCWVYPPRTIAQSSAMLVNAVPGQQDEATVGVEQKTVLLHPVVAGQVMDAIARSCTTYAAMGRREPGGLIRMRLAPDVGDEAIAYERELRGENDAPFPTATIVVRSGGLIFQLVAWGDAGVALESLARTVIRKVRLTTLTAPSFQALVSCDMESTDARTVELESVLLELGDLPPYWMPGIRDGCALSGFPPRCSTSLAEPLRITSTAFDDGLERVTQTVVEYADAATAATMLPGPSVHEQMLRCASTRGDDRRMTSVAALITPTRFDGRKTTVQPPTGSLAGWTPSSYISWRHGSLVISLGYNVDGSYSSRPGSPGHEYFGPYPALMDEYALRPFVEVVDRKLGVVLGDR